MYDALDVSRYIINALNNQGLSISNLKLQKLLYFVQGFFLALDDKPCFSNRIEAWDFGPVVPDAYHEFKIFGSNSIPPIKTYFKFNNNFWDSETIEFDESIIEDSDKYKISTVLNLFKNYSTTQLVNITHNQNPWKDVYNTSRNTLITNESIREYFKKRYLNNE